jgi:hypothetical protein
VFCPVIINWYLDFEDCSGNIRLRINHNKAQDLYGQRYFSIHISVKRNLNNVNQNESSVSSALSYLSRASITGGISSVGFHTWV